ncbi:hypothetical protein DL98DRAFT_589503 [Cadophora sp. DSE1049]|nr:hypothetical protein DL98DRAFT_589503 [Cadophora sp. DSE1049]
MAPPPKPHALPALPVGMIDALPPPLNPWNAPIKPWKRDGSPQQEANAMPKPKPTPVESKKNIPQPAPAPSVKSKSKSKPKLSALTPQTQQPKTETEKHLQAKEQLDDPTTLRHPHSTFSSPFKSQKPYISSVSKPPSAYGKFSSPHLHDPLPLSRTEAMALIARRRNGPGPPGMGRGVTWPETGRVYRRPRREVFEWRSKREQEEAEEAEIRRVMRERWEEGRGLVC